MLLKNKVILAYHGIREEDGGCRLLEYNITTLLKLGYTLLPLSAIGSVNKQKIAVLTFDDGYRDFYVKAFPILKQYRLPATVFLITDSIDRTKPFDELYPYSMHKKQGGDALNIPLRASEIRELSEYGIEM